MNHGRIVLQPRLVHILRPLAPVAVFVAFLSVLNLGRTGGSVGPADIVVPVAIVAFFGILEVTWFLARVPRSLALDEEGLVLESRQGESVRLPWSDLADRDSRVFAPGWVLVRKVGRRMTLSLFGFSRADRDTVDRRIVDVLLQGPPLAPEPRDWSGRASPETAGTLLAGLAGASMGAMLGAVGWGLLAWISGIEVGYAAIGVGALVGWSARAAGGRGPALGAACGVLVVASILTGKAVALRFSVGDFVRKEQAKVDRPMYDRIGTAASEIAAGAPESRHAAILVGLRWVETDDPAKVPADELRAFREVGIPNLRTWNHLPPRFEAWQEEHQERAREQILAGVSYTRGLFHALGALDVLFVFIGIGAALRFSGEKKKPFAREPAPVSPLGIPEAPRRAGGLIRGQKVVFPPKRKSDGGAPPIPPPASGPPPGTDPPAPRS